MSKRKVKDTMAISLEQLKAQYGEVYTIEAEVKDNTLVSYLRKPDYETRKACLKILMKDATDRIAVGELILASCHIGGDNFFTNQDLRLEAALKASDIMEFNDTVQIKKN